MKYARDFRIDEQGLPHPLTLLVAVGMVMAAAYVTTCLGFGYCETASRLCEPWELLTRDGAILACD